MSTKSSPRCASSSKGSSRRSMLSRSSSSTRAGCSRTRRRWCASSSRSRSRARSRGSSEFWQAIDVNMSVAGSYAYNFHNPTTVVGRIRALGSNAGNSGLFYPFHPDHNSFQVDQVWFDIGKETTDGEPRGLPRDDSLRHDGDVPGPGQPGGSRATTQPTSTRQRLLRAPGLRELARARPGEGVEFTFGKFATPIGAEVADASKNWDVTRGQPLQPAPADRPPGLDGEHRHRSGHARARAS